MFQKSDSPGASTNAVATTAHPPAKPIVDDASPNSLGAKNGRSRQRGYVIPD